MTDQIAYQEYIQRRYNAFCKTVIRCAALDKILKLKRQWERQVSLDYLMNEKFVQFAASEPDEEYPFTVCGQTVLLCNAALAELVKYTDDGQINFTLAQHTLVKMLEGGGKVSDYLKPEDLAGISRDELVNLCREAIEGNPAAVNDIASGKLKAMGSLFGYIKRASGGKADIKECEKIIRELLKI